MSKRVLFLVISFMTCLVGAEYRAVPSNLKLSYPPEFNIACRYEEPTNLTYLFDTLGLSAALQNNSESDPQHRYFEIVNVTLTDCNDCFDFLVQLQAIELSDPKAKKSAGINELFILQLRTDRLKSYKSRSIKNDKYFLNVYKYTPSGRLDPYLPKIKCIQISP